MTVHARSQEVQYLNLLQRTRKGRLSGNRTKTQTIKTRGERMIFDLAGGYVPLLTTKKIALKPLIRELLWFLAGNTSNAKLREQGVKIWNEWATEADELGPIYGEQWRRFPAGQYFYQMRTSELIAYVEHMAPDQFAELKEKVVTEYRAWYDTWDAFWADVKSSLCEPGMHLRRVLTDIGIDQISLAVYLLKTDPLSRRNIVTAWNPQVVPNSQCGSEKISPQENVERGRGALPACHTFFQLLCDELTEGERLNLIDYTILKDKGLYSTIEILNLQKLYALKVQILRDEDETSADWDQGFFERHQAHAKALHEDFKNPQWAGFNGTKYWMNVSMDTGLILNLLGVPKHRLHLELFQRSGDVFLGVPFNIASYSIFLHMLAAQANMAPGEFIWMCGDSHLYVDHQDQVAEQLSREIKPEVPTIHLNPSVASIFEYRFEDITIKNYDNPHPAIKAPVAV